MERLLRPYFNAVMVAEGGREGEREREREREKERERERERRACARQQLLLLALALGGKITNLIIAICYFIFDILRLQRVSINHCFCYIYSQFTALDSVSLAWFIQRLTMRCDKYG
jgi:hypothetical protein